MKGMEHEWNTDKHGTRTDLALLHVCSETTLNLFYIIK